MTPPRPAGLIFDMDGTLALSEHLHRISWNEPMAELGISIDDSIYAVHFAGKPGLHIIRDFCGLTGDAATVLYTRVHDAYWEIAFDQLQPLEGLVAFLEQTGGMPRAVCTSAQRDSAHRMLTVLGIAGHFETVVTATDVVRGKPDPEPFLLAADQLGVEPGGCVAFEDSANGLISARTAGMYCIGVGDGVHAFPDLADSWVRDYTDPILVHLQV